MPIPAEILNVERPTNTVVQCTIDRRGNPHYLVRARNGRSRSSKGKSVPRNGKVVGHIINNVYVPKDSSKRLNDVNEMKKYGVVAMIRDVSNDIVEDLSKDFQPNDVDTIMAIASLRVANPKIPANRYNSAHENSFTSIFYPNAHLSKDIVSDFLYKLGCDHQKRFAFYDHRFERIEKDDHIIVDGTLKVNQSIINTLSGFSYKSKIKATKNISILYAFSEKLREPICALVFPGNCIDASAFRKFLVDFHIAKGVLIVDKGFPLNKVRDIIDKYPDLHIISPLLRSDTRIEQFSLTSYTNMFRRGESIICCKKVATGDGKYIYSFKDTSREAKEKIDYCNRAISKNTFDPDEFAKKCPLFGTIVFESDLDLDLETVYDNYKQRWLIELMFDQYKHDEELNTTNVQQDCSVIGSEFINFISTLITCRIKNKARKAGILLKKTYRAFLDDLNHVTRSIHAQPNPEYNDEGWGFTTLAIKEELVLLGLCAPNPAQSSTKRGPRATKPKKEDFVGPRRPVGRPRTKPLTEETHVLPQSSVVSQQDHKSSSSQKSSQTTNAPGKARTRLSKEEFKRTFVGPKRPVGRPRLKGRKPATSPKPKRHSTESQTKRAFVGPRRPVGHPRTRPSKEEFKRTFVGPKRPVGRPKKSCTIGITSHA